MSDHEAEEARTIKVSFGMDEENDLRVVLHELLHAADWSKTEPWVHETSTVMARVLKRLGWERR